VYPAPGPDRALWAAQQGLPQERPSTPVFSAVAKAFSPAAPPASTFNVPRARRSSSERFEPAPLSGMTSWPTPAYTAGLHVVRAGTSPGPGSARASTVAYASGLTWLTVTRVTGWTERRTFGVGSFASPVDIGADGTAWYEPATSTSPRRVALHTSAGEFLVDSNLTRAALLRVVASLPVTGLAPPRAWLQHSGPGGIKVRIGLTAAQAFAAAGFPALAPTSLPAGYASGAAELSTGRRSRAVTVLYRSPTAQLGGEGILLYQATGERLAPPTDPGAVAVLVRGRVGRWSPDQAVLEWVENGVYLSIAAPGLDLSVVLHVASSLRQASTAA
jgi:hypothetical protein